MAEENVVVVRFTEPSKAYQALSVLKECDADGRIGLESAAVVERTADGRAAHPGERRQRRPRRDGERLADRDARSASSAGRSASCSAGAPAR